MRQMTRAATTSITYGMDIMGLSDSALLDARIDFYQAQSYVCGPATVDEFSIVTKPGISLRPLTPFRRAATDPGTAPCVRYGSSSGGNESMR